MLKNVALLTKLTMLFIQVNLQTCTYTVTGYKSLKLKLTEFKRLQIALLLPEKVIIFT